MNSDKTITVAGTAHNWAPHPLVVGAQLAYLLIERRDHAPGSCALVRLSTDTRAEAHRHEDSEDIFYVLRGKGWMWVDRSGEIELRGGVFVRIPSGVWHRPHDVEEELLLFNVWIPAMV